MRSSKQAYSLSQMIIFLVTIVVAISLGLLGLFSVYVLTRQNDRMVEDNVMDLAQTIARMSELKDAMKLPDPASVIQPMMEEIRGRTHVEFIVILNQQAIRYSHFNPDLIGKRFTGDDEGEALRGKQYVSRAVGISGPSVRAFVPILDDATGKQLGVVVVGRLDNSVQQAVASVKASVYLATVTSLLAGALGAVILAGRIKRIIRGLEPAQIATLLDEREAIVQSVREGIIAIDRQLRITLINDAARRLLGIKEDVAGQPINQIIPNSRLPNVLKTGQPEYDQEQVLNERVILTNRVPILTGKEVVGALASFRDRTEVERLAEELTGVKKLVEGLRAQSHEFMNKLHTISGLIQLGSYQEAIDYIAHVTRARQDLVSFLARHVPDPTLAGLLLGKISESLEKGINVEIDPRTHLFCPGAGFDSHDLVVILGNLLENAIYAVREQPRHRRVVNLLLRESRRYLQLVVRDQGPGIPADHKDRIFEPGFTTKPEGSGLGLALVTRTVRRLGGRILLRTVPGEGATFIVLLPKPSPTAKT
ncbi:MAG: ATP-binding protein [Firmicutes bacterium]|nr:ATP-binding protein [Bacillota bacterium]